MKKVVIFNLMLCALLMVGCKDNNEPDSQNKTSENQDYVDLGLSSGTLWKSFNEKGGYYTYGEAYDSFKNGLPTWFQWNELIQTCTWSWTGNGYKVIGKNGKTITLPAMGSYDSNGGVDSEGMLGLYWTSEPKDEGSAYFIYMSDHSVEKDITNKSKRFSVRLVK